MEDDVEYLPERGVFDRVTFQNEKIDVRSAEGTFLYAFFEVYEILRDKLNLTETKRNAMVQIAKTLPDIRHKNATAFIYGYLVSEKGRISRTTLTELSSKLELKVTQADILRYARLILRG